MIITVTSWLLKGAHLLLLNIGWDISSSHNPWQKRRTFERGLKHLVWITVWLFSAWTRNGFSFTRLQAAFMLTCISSSFNSWFLKRSTCVLKIKRNKRNWSVIRSCNDQWQRIFYLMMYHIWLTVTEFWLIILLIFGLNGELVVLGGFSAIPK